MAKMWEKGVAVNMVAGGDIVESEIEIVGFEEPYRKGSCEQDKQGVEKVKEPLKTTAKV